MIRKYPAYVQLAVAEYKLGRVAEGLATFKEALKLFPTVSGVRLHYSQVLFDLQRLDEAMAAIDEVYFLRESVCVCVCVCERARVRDLLRERKMNSPVFKPSGWLTRTFAQAIELDPKTASHLITKAALNLHKGDLPGALKLIHKALKVDPSCNLVSRD